MKDVSKVCARDCALVLDGDTQAAHERAQPLGWVNLQSGMTHPCSCFNITELQGYVGPPR